MDVGVSDSPHARVGRAMKSSGDPLPGRAALRAMLEYIDEAHATALRPIVIFDLDSTLFHTAQRNFQILIEFVAHHGQGREDLQRATELLARDGTGWNIVDDVKARGVTDPGVLGAMRMYWRDRFFTNEYLRHDQPVEGSPEFVRACHDRGALCYYLTGRDAPNMRAGTEESLRRHGFPMDHRTHLHMKGSFEDDDFTFKQGTLLELRKLGEVVGVFENEPTNANLLHRSFPDAIAVFLETIHSPGAPTVDASIYRVKDFLLQNLMEEIR